MKGLVEYLEVPPSGLSTIPPDITCIQLPANRLRESVTYLLQADAAAYVSAIIGQELADGSLELIYLFTGSQDLALRIHLSAEDPVLDSICDLTIAASFYEREAHEMLGIIFTGLDHPEHLLLPEETTLLPLRKIVSPQEVQDE